MILHFVGNPVLRARLKLLAAFLTLSFHHLVFGQANQRPVSAIEKMPNLPQPLVLRDWKKVARDFDRLAFDFDTTGPYLPLAWWDDRRINYDIVGFALPAYVGSRNQTPISNDYDAITCLAAVLGATKAGIDKSNQKGRNWVDMLKTFYAKANGTNLYMNNPDARSGQSFWYELLPSLMFYQIHDHYREDSETRKQFVAIADRLRDCCIALGASDSPPRVPNFDHTAFNFLTNEPSDNAKWKEPDAAAAVMWLEYMAFVQRGEYKYLQAARWAAAFLDERQANPSYECLMVYGAYASARMNAEQGTDHHTEKFINWVLDANSPRKWGAIVEKWGDTETYGLIGSLYAPWEYAFTMNSFLMASVMLPIVRYDDRFARALGKWVLNVAINSRYFYANAWKPHEQTSWSWAATYDTEFCIAYEGLRRRGVSRDRPVERRIMKGRAILDKTKENEPSDPDRFVVDEKGMLQVTWKVVVPKGVDHTLTIEFASKEGAVTNSSDILVANAETGPWSSAIKLKPGDQTSQSAKIEKDGPLWITLEFNDAESLGRPVEVEQVYVDTYLDLVPYASGDPLFLGWGRTDLAVYGSAFVGLLAAAVEPTNVEGILQLDCRATESFAASSYPTYLFYNPHPEQREIRVPVGKDSVDLYEVIENRMLMKSVQEEVVVPIPGDQAVLLVLCPSGGERSVKGRKTLWNDVVIDYNNSEGD